MYVLLGSSKESIHSCTNDLPPLGCNAFNIQWKKKSSPETTTYWCFLREMMGNHGKWMINNMPHSPVRMILLENIYIYSHHSPIDHSFPSPFRKHQKKPGLQGYCFSAGSWTQTGELYDAQKYLHEISWNPHTHTYIYIINIVYTWWLIILKYPEHYRKKDR